VPTGHLYAFAEARLSIVIAPKGQTTAHLAHPVHAGASCSTDVFLPFWLSSDSTCGGHAPTHQPQPVQRAGSTWGNAWGTGAMVKPIVLSFDQPVCVRDSGGF
jgi:hypothetical protein